MRHHTTEKLAWMFDRRTFRVETGLGKERGEGLSLTMMTTTMATCHAVRGRKRTSQAATMIGWSTSVSGVTDVPDDLSVFLSGIPINNLLAVFSEKNWGNQNGLSTVHEQNCATVHCVSQFPCNLRMNKRIRSWRWTFFLVWFSCQSLAIKATNPERTTFARESSSRSVDYIGRTLSENNVPTASPTETSIITGYPTFSDLTKLSTSTSNAPSSSPSLDTSEPPDIVGIGDRIVFNKLAIILMGIPEGKSISLSELETIWQNYLQNNMGAYYRNSLEAQLTDVKMRIEGEFQSRRRLLRQSDIPRLLDTENPTRFGNIEANVRLEFESIQENLVVANFTEEADIRIKSTLAPPNLQQALSNSPNFEGITVRSTSYPNDPPSALSTNEEGSDDDDQPSLVRMIIGFSLLGLVILSLIFWLHVYIKYRQKQAEDRKRTKARKNHTYIMPRPNQSNRPSSTRSGNSKTAILDGGSLASGYRRGTVGRTNSPTSVDDDDYDEDDASDPFAQELEYAATADEEAWEANQWKKDQMRKQGRVVTSMYPSILGNTTSPSKPGGGEGVEVMSVSPSTLSFPYGDDDEANDPPLLLQRSSSGSSSPPATRLPAPSSNARNSRRPPTTSASFSVMSNHSRTHSGPSVYEDNDEDEDENRRGVNTSTWSTKSYPGRKRVSFEPYGENSSGGGRISKMMAAMATTLGRQPSIDSGNERGSPDTEGTEQTSTDAVRSTASSWMEGDSVDDSMGLPMRQSRMADNSDDEDDDANNENSNDRSTSFDMMKEVAQLSEYVKQYQEKKEQQATSSTSRRLSVLSENNISRDKMNKSYDSALSRKRPPQRRTMEETSRTSQYYISAVQRLESEVAGLSSQIESNNSSSDLSTAESEASKLNYGVEEDEGSRRLGIMRMKKQKPPAPTFAPIKGGAKSGTSSSLAAVLQQNSRDNNKSVSSTSPPSQQIQKANNSSGESSSSPGSIRHSGSSSMGRLTTSSPDTPPASIEGVGVSSSESFVNSSWKPHTTKAVRNILKSPSNAGRSQNHHNRTSSSRLRALRSNNRNMLDGNSAEDQESQSDATSTISYEQPSRYKPRRPHSRGGDSSTSGIANIVNMFEAKPKTAVSPTSMHDWENASYGGRTSLRPYHSRSGSS